MAGTTVGAGVINPYNSGTSGGTIVGDAATGSQRRDLGPYVDALEGYDTPTLDNTPKSGMATQLKHEWGIKNQRPLRTTLGASYTAGGTTLTLATGFGVNAMKYMVYKVLDPTNGDEIFWASEERSGDTAPGLVYAQGGTSNNNHASGLTVEILGTAQPLTGPDHPISPIIYGSLNYNYPQRFGDSFKIDLVANATSDFEKPADRIVSELAEVARIQKLELNKTLIHGGRQAGVPGTPTAPMMGGYKSYFATNTTNLSSATLSLFNIDDITTTAWGTYRNKIARKVWCSIGSKRIISRLFLAQRQGNWSDGKVNTVLESIEFETGTYEFVVDPYMPDGELWGMDTSGVKLMPYQNNDWHTFDLARTGEYVWKSLSGTFTLEFNKEPLCWRLYGFDQTLANYPTVGM